jgi:hypothetical protein
MLCPAGVLEDLYLCIGNVSENLSIYALEPHYRSLRTLVLDFRQRLNDSRSVIRYGIGDLQIIPVLLPSLELLGLPLNIRDSSSPRYKRLNYAVRHLGNINENNKAPTD